MVRFNDCKVTWPHVVGMREVSAISGSDAKCSALQVIGIQRPGRRAAVVRGLPEACEVLGPKLEGRHRVVGLIIPAGTGRADQIVGRVG